MRPSKIKIIIGCEESGAIRDRFLARGFDAISCDLQPTRSPGPHIQRDLRNVKLSRYHAMIVHPDCTFLAVSGLHWNKRQPERQQMTDQALDFVRWLLFDVPIPYLALENPVSCISTRIRPASQFIQPYEFGDDASKKTGLWLNKFPLLSIDPKRYFPPRMVCPGCGESSSLLISQIHKGCPRCGAEEEKMRPRWSNQTDSGQNKEAPSAHRKRDRAVTYPGIADAMAEQWGNFLMDVL